LYKVLKRSQEQNRLWEKKMQKLRRWALGALGVLALLLALQVSPVGAEKMQQSPKVIAAVFHADWCPGCKKMGPDVMKTMASYKNNRAVKFVMFNLTDDKTKTASQKLAKRNGIAHVWKSHQKTGMVLLIDGKTRRVVGKIDSADSMSDMKRKIEDARQS
jgi:thiol-disulfide isomerase/thioredoxin